jgi:rRNA maturation endonuclease Nob1
MGIFDKAIKDGFGKALGGAVSKTIEKAVAPKINEATNKAVDAVSKTIEKAVEPKINEAVTQAVPQSEQPQNMQGTGTQLGGMFSGFAGMAHSFTNEAAKNMKICPACEEPANADVKFCPKCGSELPAHTVAQGAACTACGKENNIGTKFCAGCGVKLPGAIAEEQAAKLKDENVLAGWDALIPQYPKWNLGGHNLNLEESGETDGGYPYYCFSVSGVGAREIEQYKQLLKQNGFRPAGQYPDEAQLFKRVDGLVYNCDTEHAFDVSEYVSIYFTVREPSGGFDYVKLEKAEPTKSQGLGGLEGISKLGGLFGKKK